MFRIERGNWYIDEKTWAEYGIFREGEENAFVLCPDKEKADYICDLLNKHFDGEEWKGIDL